MEKRKAEISELLNVHASDHEKIVALGKEMQELTDTLDMHELRWLELKERDEL